MSRDCKIRFRGSETERVQLLELKNDLAIWQKDLQKLARGRNWSYPYVLRMLNISEHKLRYWRARLRDEELHVSDFINTNLIDDQLAREAVIFGKPRSDVRDRIVSVVAGLHRVWVAVCIKFAEAVASKYSDLDSRVYHCRELVDFDLI